MNQHEAVVKKGGIYTNAARRASAWTVGVSLARSSRTLAAYSGASLRPSKKFSQLSFLSVQFFPGSIGPRVFLRLNSSNMQSTAVT